MTAIFGVLVNQIVENKKSEIQSKLTTTTKLEISVY